MENQGNTNNPFWLITKDKNAYFVCGVRIEKITTTYGYTLKVELVNGNVACIGVANLDARELFPLRDKIINFIANPERKPEDKLTL